MLEHKQCAELHPAGVHLVSLSNQAGLSADSLDVLATLLVVGSMDKARSDILENGNVKQTSVEQLSQVCQPINQHLVGQTWQLVHCEA